MRFCLFIFALAIHNFSVSFGQEFYEWTSNSGHSTKAAFLGIDEKNHIVTLLVPREISFDALHPKSLALAKKLALDTVQSPEPKPLVGANSLPKSDEDRQFLHRMLTELHEFKDRASLREWGFSVGGPHGKWMTELDAALEKSRGKEGDLKSDMEVAIIYLHSVGLEYWTSHGAETKSSRFGNRVIREIISGISAVDALHNAAEIERQEQPAPVPIRVSVVGGVSYTVIRDDKRSGIKRVVEIQLNKRVNEDTLTTIAKLEMSLDSNKYERVYIGYFLPGMRVGEGYWATTHYEPNLTVKIRGASAYDIAKLSAKPEAPYKNEIGRWLLETPRNAYRYVISGDKGKLFMESTFNGGTGITTEIVETQSAHGRRFDVPVDSAGGDYWIIDSKGELQHRDDKGMIAVAKKLQ